MYIPTSASVSSPLSNTWEVLIFSKTTDWTTIYRAWLPQRLSHKERQHAVQEDCEVRGLCRRSPRQQKWSGAPPHPPPGGRPFQGPSPLRGLRHPSLHLCFPKKSLLAYRASARELILTHPYIHLCFPKKCLFVCYEWIRQRKECILTSKCLPKVCCSLERNKDVGMGL